LAITGYLVGYLGQQYLELQDEIRRLEVAEQRHRIARELHDNFAQALAGINLRLEGCRRQLQSNPEAEVLSDLTELQDSVKREFDHLRRYTRSLAGMEVTPATIDALTAPRLQMTADVSGSLELVDHILQIAREGINNVRRHARARTAQVEIRGDQSQVRVRIDDDGIGFTGDGTPWSIASRVKELGGQIDIVAGAARGTHLLITVPQS